MDFVALAKSLGGLTGEVVQHPGAVAAAIGRGIDHVLRNRQSYILDMRTAEATPTPPAVGALAAALPARYAAQPPLDIFHNEVSGSAVANAPPSIPLIV